MNQGYAYREFCDRRSAGRTLLDHLAARYGHSTREEWCARIERGDVRVDGVPSSPTAVLRGGMVVAWNRPPWREPDAPLDFRCVHLDDELLVVDKPAGLPTLPGADFLEHTLLRQVQERHPEATPMHRLGRFTSGLVLCARSEGARAAVARLFRDGRIGKLYRALATGRATSPAFTVDVPIGRVAYPPLGTLHAAAPDGKQAKSRVRVLEQREGTFLAEIDLITGRPHQIRIHLAAAGYPLRGDPLYAAGGAPAAATRALPGDPGYLLHATRLTVPQPFGLDLRCAPPAELLTAAESLDGGLPPGTSPG